MISAFGATEMPPSEAYFTTITPLKLAATLADIVKAHNLDGVDLDWEVRPKSWHFCDVFVKPLRPIDQDNWQQSNPGLTGYGTTRCDWCGPAIQ